MAMDKSGVSSYRGSPCLEFLVDAGWRGGRGGTTRAFGLLGEGSGRIDGLARLRDRGTSRFSRLFLLLPGSSLGLGGPCGEDWLFSPWGTRAAASSPECPQIP